jgi:hypothetical protein
MQKEIKSTTKYTQDPDRDYDYPDNKKYNHIIIFC